jgi:hypothetical protein
MISIAFLALILTVFVQTVMLQRAIVVREEWLRAMAEKQRALVAQAALDLSRQQIQK